MSAATASPDAAVEILLTQKEHQSNEASDQLHLRILAEQILHNLQYQHQWTNLKIHGTAPKSNRPLPRLLIAGLPPKRLYMHPDEQAELLKQPSQGAPTDTPPRSSHGSNQELGLLTKPIEEWVLPTHLQEKWSLRRFAEVFDAMDDQVVTEGQPWKTQKRIVLATLQDDSTVVYYIMNDGIVKPRQN